MDAWYVLVPPVGATDLQPVGDNGWGWLQGGDIAVCIAALAAISAIVGAAGALGPGARVDRGAATWTAGVAGAVALGLAVEHVLVHPFGDLMQPGWGLWAAVAASAVTVLGAAAAAWSACRE